MSGARTGRTPTNRRSRSSSSIVPPPPRLSIPDEPPKVPRRPPSKGNKRETLADIAKRIPIELMRVYFNYPLRSAAEAMHISVTTLKRLCRRHGVKRWPHRQISGINRALNDLEAQHEVAGDTDLDAVADQLRQLHRRREVIIELAFESDEETSRKSVSEDAPPAHKRGHHRNSESTDSSSSSSESSVVTLPAHTRSDSLDSTSSLDSAPESPSSIGSIEDGKPTSVWWNHTPADLDSDEGPSSSGVHSDETFTSGKTSAIRSGGIRGSFGPIPAKTRPPRAHRSSAMFGGIGRTGTKISARAGRQQHRRKSSIISGANRKSSKPPSSAPQKLDSSGVGRSAVTGKMPAYLELSVATAAAAAAAGRAGGNLFDHSMHVNQQTDDLAVLGELLFGPDETAVAAARAGVFSHNAKQWGPCVPFNPSEVFSSEHTLIGAPNSVSFSSQDVAASWGALVGDRSSLGMPANVGLL